MSGCLPSGLASVAFGGLRMVGPSAGALTVLWLTGSYAIVFGMLRLILAYKLRRFLRKLTL